jgi:hypothetical protein
VPIVSAHHSEIGMVSTLAGTRLCVADIGGPGRSITAPPVSGNALAANGEQAAATGRLAAASRTIGDLSARPV